MQNGQGWRESSSTEVQGPEQQCKGRTRLGVCLHVGMREREPDLWLEPGEEDVIFHREGTKEE